MTETDRICESCKGPIVHRDEGSGRHRWRYCSDACRAQAHKDRQARARGSLPIGRVKPIPQRKRPPKESQEGNE
jgi:hypothetical protein